MAIEVVCPNCRRRFRAKDSEAGVRGVCPFCMGPIEVPVPEADESLSHLLEVEEQPSGPPSTPYEIPAVGPFPEVEEEPAAAQPEPDHSASLSSYLEVVDEPDVPRSGSEESEPPGSFLEVPAEPPPVAAARRDGRHPAAVSPILWVAVGAMGTLLLVSMVLLLLPRGKQAEPPPTVVEVEPPAETIQTESPPAGSPDQGRTTVTAPRPAARDLVSYVPEAATVAVGFRPEEVGADRGMALAAFRSLLDGPLDATGLTREHLSEVVFASSPEGRHLLVALRTNSTAAEEAVRGKLGCAAMSSEVVEDDPLYPITGTGERTPLCAAFPRDGRTVLVGRPASVRAALAGDADAGVENGSLLRTRDFDTHAAALWAATQVDQSLVSFGQRSSLATTEKLTSIAPSLPVRSVIAAQMAISLRPKFELDMTVLCRDTGLARRLANAAESLLVGAAVLDKLDSELQIEPAAGEEAGESSGSSRGGRSLRQPREAARARRGGRHRPARDTQDAPTISGVLRTDNDGRVARLHWETSPGDPVAISLWRILSATLISSVTTSVAGEPIAPGPLRRSNTALVDLHAAEGAFPSGMFPHEKGDLWERIGWMAQLLPYVGYRELYDRVDFSAKWYEPANVPVGQTLVEAFIDPDAGEFRWRGHPFHGAAFTHFVGMAGVGIDAPSLPADHPRAGIFGYERRARLEDVTDGLGTTILMIGAGEVYGPWLSGGGATVRGARRREGPGDDGRNPYFGGRGGFGSPGSNDGVFAGFADGSVRFLSDEIDPDVFEALCTMHGGEEVAPSSLEPGESAGAHRR